MEYKQETMEEEIESIKRLIVYITNQVIDGHESETPFEWSDIRDIDVKVEETQLNIVSSVLARGVKAYVTTSLAIGPLGEGIVDYWLNFDLKEDTMSQI